MGFIFELLFEIFGELFLQLFFELFVRGLLAPLWPEKTENHPIFSAFGFFILGVVCGFLSLLVFPHHLIKDPMLQLVNLFVTPILVGLGMGFLGQQREKRGLQHFPIDRFLYGFAFAAALAMMRFWYAR